MAQNTDNRKRYDKYRDGVLVRELRTPEEKRNARVLATCGECGRSWDDAVVTSMTPAPGGRCPFEALHERSDWQSEAPTTSEMEALAGMQSEDGAEGLRGADRAAWVLAKAGSEDVSGLDLRDQVTDMIADLLLLVHRDRPDLCSLRILANAVSHMQTEIHPDGQDDPLRVTWVMGTEGDGWEVQLHDGRTVRMVVQA